MSFFKTDVVYNVVLKKKSQQLCSLELFSGAKDWGGATWRENISQYEGFISVDIDIYICLYIYQTGDSIYPQFSF